MTIEAVKIMTKYPHITYGELLTYDLSKYLALLDMVYTEEYNLALITELTEE